MSEKSISFCNSNIYYTITGKGDPVVLLHGFAEDSSIWDEQVNALKNNYTLIVPDLPGSGRSPLLPKEDCSIEDYAGCIQQILAEEKISQCTMIGHSMGGYITLAFAEKYPDLLHSFVLFHSSAYADDAEKVATRKKAIAFMNENGAAAFLKTSIPGLFYDAAKSKASIDSLLLKGKQFSAAALIQYYHAMIFRPDRTAVLKQFPGPIGFIIGQHDKAVPFQHSLQQSHIPKVAHLCILRNSAHMGMIEESGKANEALVDFLSVVIGF